MKDNKSITLLLLEDGQVKTYVFTDKERILYGRKAPENEFHPVPWQSAENMDCSCESMIRGFTVIWEISTVLSSMGKK